MINLKNFDFSSPEYSSFPEVLVSFKVLLNESINNGL